MEREKKFILSSVSTIICESFLLCLLSLLIFSMFATNKITNEIRENIKINIYLKNNINELDVLKIKEVLKNHPYIKNVSFIDKNIAAEELKKNLGEDFLDVLGGNNPIPDCINLTLKPEFGILEKYNELESFIILHKISYLYEKSQIITFFPLTSGGLL